MFEDLRVMQMQNAVGIGQNELISNFQQICGGEGGFQIDSFDVVEMPVVDVDEAADVNIDQLSSTNAEDLLPHVQSVNELQGFLFQQEQFVIFVCYAKEILSFMCKDIIDFAAVVVLTYAAATFYVPDLQISVFTYSYYLAFIVHYHPSDVTVMPIQCFYVLLRLQVPNSDFIGVELPSTGSHISSSVKNSQMTMRTVDSWQTTEDEDQFWFLTSQIPGLNELIVTSTVEGELPIMCQYPYQRAVCLNFLKCQPLFVYDPAIVGSLIEQSSKRDCSSNTNLITYNFRPGLRGIFLNLLDIRYADTQAMQRILNLLGDQLFVFDIDDIFLLVDGHRRLLQPSTHVRLLYFVNFVDVTLTDENSLLEKLSQITLETCNLRFYVFQQSLNLFPETGHKLEAGFSSFMVWDGQMAYDIVVVLFV